MRKAVPTPELISSGKWKKTDDKSARVGLNEREYYAPCDLSDSSADIRKHEYGHIKYSEPRQNAPKDFIPESGGDKELHDIAGAFEDHRVNYLMKTENDVSVAHVGDELYPTLMENIPKMPPSFAAKVYVSSRMYDTPTEFDTKLREQFKTTVDQVDALIEKLNTNPTVTNMYQVCREFKKIFEEDEQKQKDKSKGESEPEKSDSKGDGKKDESKNGSPENKEPEEKKPEDSKPEPKKAKPKTSEVKQAEKMEKKYSLSPPKDTAPSLAEMAKTKKQTFEFEQKKEAVAGEMTIIYRPSKMRQADRYKGVRLRPKRKPSAYGAALRYTNRILTDKACFSAPMRDNLGTVLVDVSGSMNMDLEALKKMMTFSGRATIALYSGEGYEEGKLYIIAKGGRCVSDIPKTDYANIIDAPALEWLITQPGPRWWISDGMVTGMRERIGPQVSERCWKACVKGKVRQVFTVEHFIELIETNKVRNYKQAYRIIYLDSNGKWIGRV